MRLTRVMIMAFVLVLAATSMGFAQDGERFDDDRRPELDMSKRDDVPYDLGNKGLDYYYRALSEFEFFQYAHVDSAGFMDRLEEVMMDEEYLGRWDEVRKVGELYKGMGLYNWEGAESSIRISEDWIDMRRMAVFGDWEDESGMYARLFALPNKELASAKLLNEGEYVMYFAANNVIDHLMIQLQSMAEQEKAMGVSPYGKLFGEFGMDVESLEEVMGMIKVMRLDQTAKETLSGEIAFAMFDAKGLTEDIQSGSFGPEDVHIALMLGINDPEIVMNMLSMYGGEAGLQKGEDIGGWQKYTIAGEPSLGFVMNDELMVLSPDIEGTIERISNARGLDIPACQHYVSINATAMYQDVMEPAFHMAKGMSGLEIGEDSEAVYNSMHYLLDVPDSDELGMVTMMYSTVDGNPQQQFSMNKAVVQYAMLLGGSAIGLAIENEDDLGQLLDGMEDMLDF